ncbi:MAG: metallophosphoesterase family protein [Clostridia bacterium]
MIKADNTAFLPAAVTYMRLSKEYGSAEGEVTIVPAPGKELKGYHLYWGDRNSNKLPDFTKIAAIESAAEEIHFRFPEGLLIPEPAEKLLVFPVLYDSEKKFFYEADCSAAVEIGAEPFRVREQERCTFAVITDLHVTVDPEHPHNKHLENCFSEIIRRAPQALGVMCIGDTTNHGYVEEWERFTALWNAAAQKGLPPLYFAVGNHDMHFYKYNGELGYQTNFETQKKAFLRYTHTDSDNFYHYNIIDGKYFIFLGPDRSIEPGESDCDVHISERQRTWLTGLLEEAASREAPAFLFLHQPLLETVSGSLRSVDPVGQVWNGVIEDEALRAITDRFPQLVMFTGHTHWKFDSLQPILPGHGKRASYVNAASVAYLWTDKNGNIENENHAQELGSEGLLVEEYDKFILLKGYDFAAGKWSASAQFLLRKPSCREEEQQNR